MTLCNLTGYGKKLPDFCKTQKANSVIFCFSDNSNDLSVADVARTSMLW